MFIEEMPVPECIEFLERTRFGRLACEQAGQPYITPIYFVYHQHVLYSFSTLGQKVSWMRANPRVCIEADEVTSAQKWTSIVVYGRYEELRPEPQYDVERSLAHSLLSERHLWWEPGYARTVIGGTERPLDLIYFRIEIGRITGHRARP